MEDKQPFWQSRKFWMEVVAAGVFLSLALTRPVTFTPEQVLIFVLGLAGIAVGAHAVTDVAAIAARARIESRRRLVVTRRSESEPEPDDG